MPTRSINTINQLVERAKSNAYGKMMLFAEDLSVGVSSFPEMFEQEILIFACESDYATLAQKNIFADMLAGNGDDVAKFDGYVQNGYWQGGYAQ